MPENEAGDGPELTAVDLFLRRYRAPVRALPRYVTSVEALIFFGLAVGIFSAFDSFGLTGVIGFPILVFVWLVSSVIQVSVYTAVLMFWGILQYRYHLLPLFLPVATAIAFAVNFSLTALHLGLYSAEARAMVLTWPVFARGLALALLFELLFLSFVLPVIWRRLERVKDAGHRIVIAGEHFDVDGLVCVRGMEHFVEIVTTDTKHRLRARLGDVVSQLDETDGVLAHRSHWVARGAVNGLVTEDGQDFIITTLGERLTVARTRRDEVRSWMARNLDAGQNASRSGV